MRHWSLHIASFYRILATLTPTRAPIRTAMPSALPNSLVTGSTLNGRSTP